MKRSSLTIAALTLSLLVSTSASAGTITGSRTNRVGTITGSAAGTITGSRAGTITGSRAGTITGSAAGTITGSRQEEPTVNDSLVGRLLSTLFSLVW